VSKSKVRHGWVITITLRAQFALFCCVDIEYEYYVIPLIIL
jgi:hypothetical protein